MKVLKLQVLLGILATTSLTSFALAATKSHHGVNTVRRTQADGEDDHSDHDHSGGYSGMEDDHSSMNHTDGDHSDHTDHSDMDHSDHSDGMDHTMADGDGEHHATSNGTHCMCNGYTRPAAGSILMMDPKNPNLDYDNMALEMAHIALSLIPGTGAEPHKIAMVGASMFEAMTVLSPDEHMKPLTLEGMEAKANKAANPTDYVLMDEYIGYAAYDALKRLLKDAPPMKLEMLDAKMTSLGFDPTKVVEHASAPYVMAVLMKYMPGPMPLYEPVNNASTVVMDADCAGLSDLNSWQPLCIMPHHMHMGGGAKPSEDDTAGAVEEQQVVAPQEDHSSVGECMPQRIPFAPLYNAPLIATDGGRNIYNLNGKVPSPPTYNADADTDDEANDAFWQQYQATLTWSAQLDDRSKFMAEYFRPNAAMKMAALAVNEAEARQLSLMDSIIAFFAVTGAARDTVVGSVTIKLDHDTVRPVTVLQCAEPFAGQRLTGWRKPYHGVEEFVNSKEDGGMWRPYLMTPPFPSYTSGHSAAGSAAKTVLTKMFPDGMLMSNNCAVQQMGMSRTEPMISDPNATGYIEGMTDVPNSGPDTVGFSPALDVTLCWDTFESFTQDLSSSRVYGGIHIPDDINYGYEWGELMGAYFYDFVMKQTTDGDDHDKEDDHDSHDDGDHGSHDHEHGSSHSGDAAAGSSSTASDDTSAAAHDVGSSFQSAARAVLIGAFLFMALSL